MEFTKASTEAVAASSSGDSEDNHFASPTTHLRASTLRRGRRPKGFKGRGQNKDMVKGRRPKDEYGDFQYRDSSIRRAGLRKGFLCAGSCNKWSSASRDLLREPSNHLTFASSSSEDEETDENRSTLLRSRPSELKSSARCERSTTRKLSTRTKYKPLTNQVERFYRTLNSVLAKTVSEHQKDWDVRLLFAVVAHRSTRHKATGYIPNHLVFGREVRAPVDIVFGSPNDKPTKDYDTFVERMRERFVEAFAEVRRTSQRSVECNKRHYELGLKPKTFKVGQWVMYFNPRKLRGQQMKCVRQYEGPFLIVKSPCTLTAKIRRTPKATPKTVHIDKLKDFVGTTPRSWINGAAENTNATEMLSKVEQHENASFSPEASEQRRRRKYGQPPRFVLNGPTLVNDGVTSSKPGPDETLVKRSSGGRLVNGRSKIVWNFDTNSASVSLRHGIWIQIPPRLRPQLEFGFKFTSVLPPAGIWTQVPPRLRPQLEFASKFHLVVAACWNLHPNFTSASPPAGICIQIPLRLRRLLKFAFKFHRGVAPS